MPVAFVPQTAPNPQLLRGLARDSKLPRPMKQLAPEQRKNGINHASKPTVDTLPVTPAIKLARKLKTSTQKLSTTKPKLPHHDSDPELAILELVPFSKQPVVNFGQVQLNATKIKYVIIRNTLTTQQQLTVQSFPKPDKGFYIDATEFLIAPHTEICVSLAWTPRIAGGLRETITLQDRNRMPRRIVLIGMANKPKSETVIVKRTARAIPRLYQKTPTCNILKQDKIKTFMSPRRMSGLKPKRSSKPLRKLIEPTPKKQHQIVRNILWQRAEAMRIKVGAAIIIQSAWRGLSARRAFIPMRDANRAAVKIQSRWKGYSARRGYNTLRSLVRAVVVIQSMWRASIARRQFTILKRSNEAATVIQTRWRGLLARRKYSYQKKLIEASVTVQSRWRGVIARRRFADLKNSVQAATIIQARWRGLVARRQFASLKRSNQAAVIIQSAWRGLLARRTFTARRAANRAAIVIQSNWRGLLARRRYNSLRVLIAASVVIQSTWRAVIARRKLASLKRSFRAAVIIQARWRGLLARRQFTCLKESNRAAVIIQSAWRGHSQRVRYANLRRSVQKALLEHWSEVYVGLQLLVSECLEEPQRGPLSAQGQRLQWLATKARLLLRAAGPGSAQSV